MRRFLNFRPTGNELAENPGAKIWTRTDLASPILEGLCLGPYGGPTGVPRLCLGPYGGPTIRGGRFLMSEGPVQQVLRAACSVFRYLYTLSAPPPLPELSPRTTDGSVGNRAVHARKFQLEGADFWYRILIELNEPC